MCWGIYFLIEQPKPFQSHTAVAANSEQLWVVSAWCAESSSLLPCRWFLIHSINFFFSVLNDKVGGLGYFCLWMGRFPYIISDSQGPGQLECSLLIPQIAAVTGPCLFLTWAWYLLIRLIYIIVLFPHGRVAFPSQQAHSKSWLCILQKKQAWCIKKVTVVVAEGILPVWNLSVKLVLFSIPLTWNWQIPFLHFFWIAVQMSLQVNNDFISSGEPWHHNSYSRWCFLIYPTMWEMH